MSKDEKNTASADKAGSADDLIKAGPEASAAGEPDDKGAGINEKSTTETVDKSQYEELESKLGEQGQELGEYRDFLKQVGPLLDELDQQPELVKAIMDGKIDKDLVQAAMDGKVSIAEAETVSKAHEDVKKTLGKKVYEKTAPEDIQKLVADQVAEATKGMKDDFNKNISNVEEIREFENRINDFISNTDDFADYAVDIEKWFESHPDQDDIEIAYNSVKGKFLADVASQNNAKTTAEEKKAAAANAAGGGSQSAQIIEDKDVIDSLISPKSNPNTF